MSDTNHKVVYVTHAIDTEGPLYESLDAKFERIKELFNIELQPTRKNFIKLQNGEIDLGGDEEKIKLVLSGHLITYNDSWDKVDEMLSRLMSDDFRYRLPDSNGGGWKFTWHCLDHVRFDYNPRRRDIGFHNIFDSYKIWVNENCHYGDEIEWHFHPMSTYADAHRCATSYFGSDVIYQVLSRKVIERQWFPSSFRAGFQTERADSHWFLEQWIPFDITNMAIDDPSEFDQMIDFKNGRSGDWRRAPSDWSIYHPDHDDYQKSGNCRRLIGRALNVMNRLASIDQYEVDKAFEKARNDNAPVLMGITGHDFRNLEVEVDYVRNLIHKSNKKYPDVSFKYSTVPDGFRKVYWPNSIPDEKLSLSIEYVGQSKNDVPHVNIKTLSGKTFGPQPFFCIETKSRRFIHDNLDFSTNEGEWSYAFHSDTLPIEDVKTVAVAANDKYGNKSIKRIDF